MHVSRGVRWDSDHVVILSDELQAIAQEIVRGGYLNRVVAWVIGTRNALKALLMALLEELKEMPFGAVWDCYCLLQRVPLGPAFIGEIRKCERHVLTDR